MRKPQPWSPTDATRTINEIARSGEFTLGYTRHAKDRMVERGLLIGDAIHVLKNGFVYEKAEPSNSSNVFKYKIEGRTPNSKSRSVRVVAIPDERALQIKIITIMWVDE